MDTQLPDWLAQSSRDGRGGLSAEPQAINRGRTCVFVLNLSTSDDYGDWTGGAFAADLRLLPDAAGAALASYTASIGTPAGGITPVTFTLDNTAQSGLPADEGTGLVELFLEVTYTPSGGDEYTLISTRQMVSGVV